MAGGALEAKLVITGEDKSGAAFEALLKHVDSIGRALKQVGAADKAIKPLDSLGSQAGRIDATAKSVDRLGRSLDRIGRQEGRIAGVVRHLKGLDIAAAGYGAARVGHKGIDAANDLSNATNQLRMAGLKPGEVSGVLTKAGELSSKYPSVSQAQVVDMIRTQRSVTGSLEEAMHAIDDNVRLRSIAQMKHPGQPVGEGMELLNKAMEMAGVTSDPARHHRYMDHIAKMIQTFGASLKFEDIADMVKYSRGAAFNLSEGFFSGIMPSIAAELGGTGAGTALATTHQAIVGGQMKHSAALALNSYGLVDPAAIIRTKTGSIKGIKAGGVVGSKLFQEDPFEWVQKHLKPALEAKGVTDPKAQGAAISTMFSNRMAQQFVMLMLQQATRLEKDRALAKGAEGLPAADLNKDRDSGTAIQGLTTSMQNFLATVGGPLVDAAIPAINSLSAALNNLAKAAQDNPTLGGALGVASLGLGGLASLGIFKAAKGIVGSLFGGGGAAAVGPGAAGSAIPGGVAAAGTFGALVPGLITVIGGVLSAAAASIIKASPGGFSELPKNPLLGAMAPDMALGEAILNPPKGERAPRDAMWDGIKSFFEKPVQVQGEVQGQATIAVTFSPSGELVGLIETAKNLSENMRLDGRVGKLEQKLLGNGGGSNGPGSSGIAPGKTN